MLKLCNGSGKFDHRKLTVQPIAVPASMVLSSYSYFVHNIHRGDGKEGGGRNTPTHF